jgi:hypothetical protein
MKTLICLNTCARALNIKALSWGYIDFCKDNNNYDFIISLDGIDEKTIDYCNKFNIPLLYSEEREGVGLSKNRVLESYKDYDYYFFIEDDAELLNPKIFDIHIELSKKLDIHHFSLFDRSRFKEIIDNTKYKEYNIIHSLYGGAPFNFFTKEGLDKVGGFHTLFAEFKRFGHTEHTYRFVNNNLSKYPFNVIENLIEGYCRWNDPLSVTQIKVATTKNRLFKDEEVLINSKLKYFKLKTISKYTILNIDKEIIKDKNIFIYKFIFYTNINVLNTLRKIKRLIIGFIK